MPPGPDVVNQIPAMYRRLPVILRGAFLLENVLLQQAVRGTIHYSSRPRTKGGLV